jgi:transcriptional regulator with XRE-family HTH domain
MRKEMAKRRFHFIAETLRQLRNLSGLTQSELARSAFIFHWQQISNIESGSCSIPHSKFAHFAIVLSRAIAEKIRKGEIGLDHARTKEEMMTELVEAKLCDEREYLWHLAEIAFKHERKR